MLVKGVELKPGNIDSNTLTATEATAILAWEITARKAAGEIYLVIERDQIIHLSRIEDYPVAIWMKLESVHLQKHPGSHFLFYDTFFSIQKKKDGSLTSLMTRINEGMIQVKNLHSKDFKLEDQDEELVCMGMIQAPPLEFNSFVSFLQFLDKLEKCKLQKSFIAEEHHRLYILLFFTLQVSFFASHPYKN